ncbi:cell division protein FtsW [Novosphingobium chloroacetimidivorans]|uniref:Probable peptidoglycan glycosyltransferase FtsW n=1 Tax=Novosphingobium chloroacetimidivorans TaxID=1428314 RepID=A0A7W7K9K7_9SPHN|nr:putative peptidoglycan glycosyltransferase FtsW [Novosphingobium chloroacetimidivorans]MBB4858466.1 cell division protein FtsW [Novosphingobium chloroacetimidivorans]
MASTAPAASIATGNALVRYNRSRRSAFAIWWQEIDRVTLGLVLVLMAIGTVSVAAASPASARRLSTSAKHLSDLHFFAIHLRWQALGLVALFVSSTLSKDTARRLGIMVSGVMIVALMLVPFIGGEVNGARRWINLGISIQPSEFLKCGFPILLAWILSWRVRDGKIPVMQVTIGLMGLIAVLLMAQPDFGSTMLFGATWFVLILLSGLDVKRIIAAVGAGLVGITLAYFFYENGRNRIDAFLGGGSAYDQVALAERTLLNGGWLGTGFWMGTRKLSLPEAHTDYIFSVIGEEFGLWVCGVVILLYSAIMVRSIMRQVREDDLFTVLAGVGLAAQFGGQAFINILVNLQLFPSKGMTLPLVSYGGSSTVAMCTCLGLLLAITRRNPFIERERFSLSDVGDVS